MEEDGTVPISLWDTYIHIYSWIEQSSTQKSSLQNSRVNLLLLLFNSQKYRFIITILHINLGMNVGKETSSIVFVRPQKTVPMSIEAQFT